MFVSGNPGSQPQLCELAPPTHVRAARMCAYGNRQHFCTDGRGKFSLALQCVSRGLVFTRRITAPQATRWLNTLALDQHLLRYHVEVCLVVGSLLVCAVLVVVTHPQPPERSQHECTVGVDRDPPVR